MSKVFEDFLHTVRILNAPSIMEDAPPTDIQRSKTYYHGTSTQAAAKSILQIGLKPPDKTGKNWMAPVEGRVYLAPTLSYAMIYAAGGAGFGEAGSSPDFLARLASSGEYGYVFVVDGKDLADVQPDEDNVGELAAYVLAPRENSYLEKGYPELRTTLSSGKLEWLKGMANRHITDSWKRKMIDGEYMYWAKAGKKLLSKMADWQKQQLIDLGANIANQGSLKPKEVWRFHKVNDIPRLKADGSNFFQIAKKVTRV